MFQTKNQIFSALSILSLLYVSAAQAAGPQTTAENYTAMVQAGCNSLLTAETSKSVDGSLLNGVSADQFQHLCQVRADHFLKVPPAGELVGDKYSVSLIQTVCMGAVSPDLYKNQEDWVRTRISCVKNMLESSKAQELKSLAQHIVPLSGKVGGSRSPASDVFKDRETLHGYERQLNAVLYKLTP